MLPRRRSTSHSSSWLNCVKAAERVQKDLVPTLHGMDAIVVQVHNEALKADAHLRIEAFEYPTQFAASGGHIKAVQDRSPGTCKVLPLRPA